MQMAADLPIFCTHLDDIVKVMAMADGLPLNIEPVILSKLNNKYLGFAFTEHNISQALLFEKDKLSLVQYKDGELIKVSNEWHTLTKRIVTAGRKSELLLQAAKLAAGQSVIDGTAGFGHDSLILASTGAMVMMCENNPIMALMLMHEHHRMQSNANWQGLLSRIKIYHGNVLDVRASCDLVYLDPMFPQDSYSAKVGKTMQALHAFVAPPSRDDEIQLLNHAVQLIHDEGRVIIKRPVSAPHLAQQAPIQSWQNDAVRFDQYHKHPIVDNPVA